MVIGSASTIGGPEAAVSEAVMAADPSTTVVGDPASTEVIPDSTVSGVSGVSLKFDGSSISVASLSPQANWVYKIATNGPRTVEIKFFNVAIGNDREFHATVEGGQIKVET